MSEDSLRLDKWLWYARFFKTRSLATKVCTSGKLRLGGALINKAHHKLKPGDVLTFPQGNHIRVIRVVALAERRGPASEAQALYEDLKPPEPANRLPRQSGPASSVAARERGAGRPTKRERRALERLKGDS